MTLSTRIKNTLNALLRPANLKLKTLSDEKIEANRIQRQASSGHFKQPVFPLLTGMTTFDVSELVATYNRYRIDVERMIGGALPGNFNPRNPFFTTPDAELLYLMIRSFAPKRIIEIGSGNSTRIIRQAIEDGGLTVFHVAIDPEPRADITGLADSVIRERFEEADIAETIRALEANDILFIDSSHQVHVANDVVKLFCNVIPELAPGVAVHVHDVFLPYDYPEPFHIDYPGWGEQYLLQVLLASKPHDILWPGYYLQKMHPEVQDVLPFLLGGRAQSFWFKT
jgi:uncharacterized UPF0146 family protein